MRAKFVTVALYGGQLPGLVKVPLEDGDHPQHVDAVRGEVVARYVATSDADEQGYRIYRPVPEQVFTWEDPA